GGGAAARVRGPRRCGGRRAPPAPPPGGRAQGLGPVLRSGGGRSAAPRGPRRRHQAGARPRGRVPHREARVLSRRHRALARAPRHRRPPAGHAPCGGAPPGGGAEAVAADRGGSGPGGGDRRGRRHRGGAGHGCGRPPHVPRHLGRAERGAAQRAGGGGSLL
ncbi:MAG: hypothetical protein AVDCRST_MAG20-2945, partial [uncultured Acidimicrobiales bacterium]